MIERESQHIEYKTQKTVSYLKTVSAFANYGGGKIIFGVADDGSMVGLEDSLKDFCLDVENAVNDSIDPKPDFSLKLDEKTRTVTLEIYEGVFKPYLYKGKAYKRNDSSTVEVDRLELRRLILVGQNQNYESLPSPRQRLMFKTLEKELVAHLGIAEISKDILRTLGLFANKTEFNIAAFLLADKNSAPGIDIVHFGESINKLKHRATVHDVSVIEQYLTALQEFRRYYKTEVIYGAVRKSTELIPETAFREALANALCHREWDVSAHIRISFFDDRIELSSPGGLPAGLSKEEYLDGQVSLLRNPILAGVFFRLEYIERFGTGVLRIRADYEKSAVKPVFKIYENSICVVLPVMQTEPANLSPDESKVYALLKNRKLSREQIAAECGWKKDKTIRVLAKLAEKNLVERSGSGKRVDYGLLEV